MKRLLAFYLLLLISGLACPPLGAATSEKPGLLFVIQNGKLHPLAKVQGGRYTEFSLERQIATDENPKFADAGLVPKGTRVRLYASGRLIGVARAVRTVIDQQEGCSDEGGSNVRVTSSAKVPESGLASTRRLRSAAVLPNRDPDAVERDVADGLVETILRGRGMKSDVIAEMRKSLVIKAAYLSRHVSPALIVAATYEGHEGNETKTASLFLIAERDAGGYATTYVNFAQGPGGESGAYGSSFIDHVDLDGDGFSEILVTHGGYEWWSYAIFKKFEGQWQQVHAVGGGGC